MQNLKIAMVQSSLHWEDRPKNLSAFDKALSSMERDVNLVVLPEMFPSGFSMNCRKLAEPPLGEAFQWMHHKAATLNACIAGSIIVSDTNHFFNRLYLVSPDGSYSHYDKRHLFRMAGENLSFTAGNRRVIAHIGPWKVLLLVCYDLRFPVWSRNRYNNGNFDYDMILIVANWPASRNRVWKTLLQARAIDNQCYVVGVNRTGFDGQGTPHQGDSMLVSPRGEILGGCENAEQAVACASISLEVLNDFRKQFQVALDWDDFRLKDE